MPISFHLHIDNIQGLDLKKENGLYATTETTFLN